MMFDLLNNHNELKSCIKNGLQAVKGKERAKFEIKDSRKLKASVDIDTCLKNSYPSKNRWDYLIIVDNSIEGYFVEIHPASTSEVETIISKKRWLENEIIEKVFKSVEKSRYQIIWLATDAGVHILKTSKQYKRLIKEGLLPQRKCII